MADETADPELAEPADRNVEVIGVDFEADVLAVDLEAVDSGRGPPRPPSGSSRR